jgi:sec-independent protein translocase protein TatB
MLRPMFGMGGTEILVILVVALLFLGPEKLPEAASKISKGIRDIRKQTRELQTTIENDTEIGGAIRDLKSALRGDEPRGRLQPRKEPPPPKPADGTELAAAVAPALDGTAPTPEAPALAEPRMPETAGEPAPLEEPTTAPGVDDSNVATLIRPAPGTVAKGEPKAS